MKGITKLTIDQIPAYEGEHAIEGIQFRAAASAIGVSSWGMNVLDLAPGCDGHPEHAHPDGHEEVYVILKGSIELIIDGDSRERINAGEMVRVAPEKKRKLVAGEEGARVLALGGTPGKAYQPSMGG